MKFQDPKYEPTAEGFRNRQSGELIPLDEPVFLFRARDRKAADSLCHYMLAVSSPSHADAVADRINDFDHFAKDHPDRMKEPDTEREPS